MIVTSENTEPSKGSFARYTAEASELGLAPGVWPASLDTSLGNGQPFVLSNCHDDGTRRYVQGGDSRAILVVFND